VSVGITTLPLCETTDRRNIAQSLSTRQGVTCSRAKMQSRFQIRRGKRDERPTSKTFARAEHLPQGDSASKRSSLARGDRRMAQSWLERWHERMQPASASVAVFLPSSISTPIGCQGQGPRPSATRLGSRARQRASNRRGHRWYARMSAASRGHARSCFHNERDDSDSSLTHQRSAERYAARRKTI
jgi:hypothetical protein